MTSLNGKWKLASVEGFGAYLDAIGCSAETKAKGMQLLNPENNIVQTIEIDGTKVRIITTTPMGNTEFNATLGEASDQQALDGRAIKTTYTLEGESLVEKQSGAFESVNTRHLEGSDMVYKLTSNGVSSVRIYKKV